MTVSLETDYLGLTLPHPLMAAASPLGRDVDRMHRLASAGAAAIVMPSLFEEQLEHGVYQVHEALEFGSHSFAEAMSYLPEMLAYNSGPDTYVDILARAVAEVPVPVIPSLNGSTTGGWTRYAARLEEAGAPALELNVYFVAADPDVTGEGVERRYLEIVESVRSQIEIPLAVKVAPFFSSMGHMAGRFVDAGADGLVLFNRFYEPDIDLAELEVVPHLELSTPWESRLPLRWIAILRGRVEASLAATSGIHDHEDVVKLLLAGADVTMMASALLRHGPGRLAEVRAALESWLTDHEYESVRQMKGSMSQAGAPDPGAFERANYMETLINYAGRES